MTPPRTDRTAVLFVHLVVLACCLSAGWLVTTQGFAKLPTKDEYSLLAQYASMGEDLPAWVMVHHNEHRYPLAKLIWLKTLHATGWNFRAPMYVTLGLHTAAAVMLVWAVRGWRGHASLADAVIPVTLLHWGHGHNLLFSYQLAFALTVYGMVGWVWAAGRFARGGGAGWVAAAGLFGSAIILSGGFGVIFTPLMVVWMLFAGWHRRTPAVVGVALLFAVAWAGYTGWVWQTRLESPPTPEWVDRTVPGLALHTLHYLAVGTGVDVAQYERSGWAAVPVWAAAGVVYLLAFGTLTVGWVRGLVRGPMAAALWLSLVGMLLLGGASAYVRGYGIADRFVTPSAVGLALCWLAITGRKCVSWPVTAAVLVACTAWYAVTLESGRREGYYNRLVLTEMAADIDAGTPPVFLTGRYGWTLPVLMFENTEPCLREMRNAGIGPFARIGPDPKYTLRPMDVPELPVGFYDAIPEPVEIRFPNPPAGVRVIGIRVRVQPTAAGGWQKLALHWTEAETGEPQSTWVLAPWGHERADLALPLTGRPVDLRLKPASSVRGLIVQSAEWMVGE